jgi:hypothetical protein
MRRTSQLHDLTRWRGIRLSAEDEARDPMIELPFEGGLFDGTDIGWRAADGGAR